MTLPWTKVDLGLRSPNYVTPLPAPVERMEGTATHVCRWYNRDERSWVVSLSDANGYQIGSSEYVYSREDAEGEARYFIWLATPGRNGEDI